MTATDTRTAAFTITHARYIGAKIGADLRLLNGLYGRPSLARIDDYTEEAALLLRDGYLRTVDYGFKDDQNAWNLRLRYTATTGGYLADDRPGKLPAAAAVAGYGFYSYLTYNTAFDVLAPARKASVLEALPVSRVGADEPTTGAGSFTSGHGYASNGTGVSRDVFTAF